MKQIYKSEGYRVYLLTHYTDIKHIMLLLTKKEELIDFTKEDLLLHVQCTYGDGEMYIYKYTTLEDFTLNYVDKYNRIILNAVNKYLGINAVLANL